MEIWLVKEIGDSLNKISLVLYPLCLNDKEDRQRERLTESVIFVVWVTSNFHVLSEKIVVTDFVFGR